MVKSWFGIEWLIVGLERLLTMVVRPYPAPGVRSRLVNIGAG